MQWRQLQAEIMGWEEGPENQDFTPDRLDLPENELQEIKTGTGGSLKTYRKDQQSRSFKKEMAVMRIGVAKSNKQ